jgi:hypothetical protein
MINQTSFKVNDNTITTAQKTLKTLSSNIVSFYTKSDAPHKNSKRKLRHPKGALNRKSIFYAVYLKP